MEYIGINWKVHPTEHAIRAYQNGYYLEAVQILHGFLEAKMRDLLMVSRHGNIKRGYDEIWDITQDMGFNVLARVLFVNGKFTKMEFAEIQKFNALRNRIVHRFFWEPYQNENKGIPRRDYDRMFNAGIALVGKIDFKAGNVLAQRGAMRGNKKRSAKLDK